MRGLLRVQHQLNRVVEARDAQHRTLRNGDAANQLRLALVFHIGRPAQVGHLKPQRIDLAMALIDTGPLADATAANPSPYRNRFNADGTLWLATYEQRKTPAEFARLIARIKDGTISFPLNTVVSCFGGQPVGRAFEFGGEVGLHGGLRRWRRRATGAPG
jgi:hypothetical protein